MHLYGSIVSPFVQRVLLTARAKGHDLAVSPPPGEDGMRSPEFREISPMGRIPLLALDDGSHLAESDAIAGYLDEILAGPSLMPGTAIERARVREAIAVIMLEIATGLRPLMVHLVFRAADVPGVVEAARAQANAGFDALDRLLDADGPYAMGGAITAVDAALVPVLTLTRMIEPMTGAWTMATARPAIARYAERALAQPLPARTVVEMEQGFAAVMARNAAG